MAFLQSQFECVRNDVGRLVDVAQTMSFIDDHKVPGRRRNVRCLAACKMIGAYDDGLRHFERFTISLLDCLVVSLSF